MFRLINRLSRGWGTGHSDQDEQTITFTGEISEMTNRTMAPPSSSATAAADRTPSSPTLTTSGGEGSGGRMQRFFSNKRVSKKKHGKLDKTGRRRYKLCLEIALAATYLVNLAVTGVPLVTGQLFHLDFLVKHKLSAGDRFDTCCYQGTKLTSKANTKTVNVKLMEKLEGLATNLTGTVDEQVWTAKAFAPSVYEMAENLFTYRAVWAIGLLACIASILLDAVRYIVRKRCEVPRDSFYYVLIMLATLVIDSFHVLKVVPNVHNIANYNGIIIIDERN